VHFYLFVARCVVLVIGTLSLSTEMAYHKCKHYRIVFWSLLTLALLHLGEAICFGLRLVS